MIDPTAKRCASVVADGDVVVVSVPEASFAALAHKRPELWRRLALELGGRLRQRNSLVRPTNPRPVLFIGSSAESLSIVRVIESELAHDNILVKPWPRIFGPSHFPVDDLITVLGQADFAAFVVCADDVVTSRKKRNVAPRQMSSSSLVYGADGAREVVAHSGRRSQSQDPKRLNRINPLKYKVGPERDFAAALGPAVNELRGLIKREGCR